MAVRECSAFSDDGKHFLHYGTDGKLKVWDTGSGVLSQEYTPNLHLSAPCTCVTWVTVRNSQSFKKSKKRKSLENEMGALAMGTVSGNLLLYSVASSSVVGKLEEGHSYPVKHVSWARGCNMFSCDAQYIVEWDIDKWKVKSKWKTRGTEQLTCLLALPDGKLVAAGNTIGVWDVPNKSLLWRFTGHASQITSLTFVQGRDNYFISSANNDRYLYAWSLKCSTPEDKNAVASFVMEDTATSVSVNNSGIATLVAVTRNGILHLYRHQLNGKCGKPIKPTLTVQIASDSSQSKEVVQPIPILGAYQIGTEILIARGSSVKLSFETISPKSDEKVMFLIRKDSREIAGSSEEISKVKQPLTSNNVEYIYPAGTSMMGIKRSKKTKSDVPMEKRLDNLSLTRQEHRSGHPPHSDSMAQLLMQGLESQDIKILQHILLKKDPSIIQNTIKRLPVQCTVPLVKELVNQVQRKGTTTLIAVHWLKAVMRTHAGHLMANTELNELLAPIMGLVERRLNLLAPLSRLRGRLDLLVEQIEDSNKCEANQGSGEGLLVYQEQDSDEGSALEDAAAGSESEDHWEELSEMDAEDDDVEETEMDEDKQEIKNDNASMSS